MNCRIGLKNLFDPFEHRICTLLRRPIRKLRHHNKVPLILLRQKTARQADEHASRQQHDEPEHENEHDGPYNELTHDTGIASLSATEHAVEPFPEPAALTFAVHEKHAT